VAAAINTFLDPLGRCFARKTPGSGTTNERGADSAKSGWDFGADLFPTSLFSVILQVKDVKAVPYLGLKVNGQPHELNDPVTLAGDGLLYGSPDHDITVVPSVDR
jgi:hypothetical protein